MAIHVYCPCYQHSNGFRDSSADFSQNPPPVNPFLTADVAVPARLGPVAHRKVSPTHNRLPAGTSLAREAPGYDRACAGTPCARDSPGSDTVAAAAMMTMKAWHFRPSPQE